MPRDGWPLGLLLLLAACTRPNPAFTEMASIDASGDGPGHGASDGSTTEAGPEPDGGPEPDEAPPPDAEAPPPDTEAPPPDGEPADTMPPADGVADVVPDATPPPPDGPWPGADSGPEAATDRPPTVTCGNARPDISSITGSDGIAIAPDGAMYFTSDDGTHGWVGRLVGTTLTRQWLRINWAPITSGLALDRTGTKLYVASVSGRAILRFDLAANPVAGTTVLDNVQNINDVVIAPDGSTIYYSRQSDRHVHAHDPITGVSRRITMSIIGIATLDQAPAGLTFGPDGALYVGLRKGGNILRLVLSGAGFELERAAFGSLSDWANGLAFDQAGRLYVGIYDDALDRKVVRLEAGGGAASDIETGGRFASMAFGRGTLDCHDLYIAVPSGPMRRHTTDTPGFVVAP